MKVRVPISALSLDDTKPQPGDPVDLTASGKLDSIDGEFGVVEVDTLNGAPVPPEAAAGEPDGDEVRRMAEAADGLPFGTP